MKDSDNNPQGLSLGDFSSGKCDIQTSILESALEEIKIKELRQVGKNLHMTLTMIDYMISLPYLICAFQHAEFNKIYWEIKGRLESGVSHPDKADKESRMKYVERMKEISKNAIMPQMDKLVDKALEEGDITFMHYLESDRISTPYFKGILRSGITLMWCYIEVFMRDLWETSLNIGGKTIIGNTLKSIEKLKGKQDVENVQGKFINIEYLAKFDYDLSKVMGTALLHKFDFTSLYGIREAFRYAFPKSENIQKAIESEILIELSMKRNVIVHNTGIIDEEYCLKLGENRTQIGKEIAIDNHNICELGKGVTEIGIVMLNAVSSIINADSN